MAKALLKTDKTACESLADDEDPDCILEAILYGKLVLLCNILSANTQLTPLASVSLANEEIVNTQNLQIQAMYDYLDTKRFQEVDNCDVFVETVADTPAKGTSSSRRLDYSHFLSVVGASVVSLVWA